MMDPAFTVALIDRTGLAAFEWESVLSPGERAEAGTYVNAVRRERTIGSRVLAKYLLTRPGAGEEAALLRPSADEIAAAGSPAWREIEVLSGTASRRVGPRVVRRGSEQRNLTPSASHCGTFTAAMIARGPAGIDLERVEPRRREFYAHMFSPEERTWAALAGREDRTTTELAFTVLWTVKEAFLKASGQPGLSVWNFPRWTVRFHGETGEATGAYGSFYHGPASIFCREFSQTIGVAANSVGNMILTAVGCSGPAAEWN